MATKIAIVDSKLKISKRMKKPFRILATVLLVMGSVACSDDEPAASQPVPIEINATHEPFDPQSRTQLGNNIISWSNSDQITVWTPDAQFSALFRMLSPAGVTARFGGDILLQEGKYVAFYPGSWQTTFDGAKLAFVLPEEMPAAPGKLHDATNPSLAYGDVADMQFSNLCGLLKFRVSGSQALRHIIFEGAGGEILSGNATVDVTAPYPVLKMADGNTRKRLTTETQLSEEPQTFYLVLPAGIYDGFSITLGDATGDEYTQLYEETTVIERGRITEFPAQIKYLDQLERRADPLDKEGTANCYVVTAPGTYYFDCTVKGCTQESVGAVSSARTVWSEKADLISDLSVENGKLIFTAGAEAGNTLVAVTDADGSILWSWHIWCTGGETPADKTLINFSGKSLRVMDRNLGAYSVTGTEATLYQYGRKDPFSNANALYVGGEHKDTYRAWYSYLTRNEAGAKNNDVIAYAIQHPDAYITGSGAAGWLQTRDQTLWGDPDGWSEKYALEMSSFSGAKTAYDPCPAGYRVPNVWSFTGFTIDGKHANMMIGNINLLDQAWNGGWLLKGCSEDTEGVFFPGTGYWITYKNTVWDPEGTYFYRAKQSNYSYSWLASSPARGSGNAGALRIYFENEVNCGCNPQDTQRGDYALNVRCVRDDYNY